MSDDEFGDDFLAGLEDTAPSPLAKRGKGETAKKSVNFRDLPENEMPSGLDGLGLGGLGSRGSASNPARTTTLSSVLDGEHSLFDNAPRRNAASLDMLFGPSKRKYTSSIDPPTAAQPPPSLPPATIEPPKDNLDAGRILRLEAELERLNRELEDIKRKKREDEEDLESFWKAKLDAQVKDGTRTLEEVKNTHKSQITILQEENQSEIDRLKRNFERQLENMTSSASQVGDLVAVVGKVDTISNSIDKIAADVVASTNKVSSEQTAMLQIQEEKLRIREERHNEEVARLKIEQLKVQELNSSLNDLLKKNEDLMEQEKWKVREEWNRLKSERQIFKEDQKHILENLQKEKAFNAKILKNFHESQHDILVRVSTERQLMEQEKNEFFAKRDQDIKRIKSEAYELDLKTQQVQIAEQHVAELKSANESKFRQLQHLEQLLTSECSEIERMRNEMKSEQNVPRRTNFDDAYGQSGSNPDSQRRVDYARASLKKHYEFLDKYAGQKVATVAPQNN